MTYYIKASPSNKARDYSEIKYKEFFEIRNIILHIATKFTKEIFFTK